MPRKISRFSFKKRMKANKTRFKRHKDKTLALKLMGLDSLILSSEAALP